MLATINLLANLLITIGGLAFYVMLFTKIGDGVKQIDSFGQISYYTIKVGLAFIVSGSLLNVLLRTTPPFTEILLNCGFGLIFMWAALWHGRKFGVITGIKTIDRKTSANRMSK
jgi:hypothetical protein